MQENGDTGERAIRASLAEALTFHASFDHGPDADFSLGDGRIDSVMVENGQETGELMPGLGQPALTIAESQGRFGAALKFTLENSHVVLFKAARNVAYSQSEFGGTASFWMSVDAGEIPQPYCDPFQLTDKDYSDACIWADFTKNDTPPDFRLGCFGNQKEWDVSGQRARSEQFYYRLVKVAEPPFAKGQWTHVAITWNGLNTSQPGRARLYFNAEYKGATGRVGERFTWDVEKARIRLGTGYYVGLFDDLAFFNRPFAADEVRALYELGTGVAELAHALKEENPLLVSAAKKIARQWVYEKAANTSGFFGAYLAGSINWLPDEADLPATSDVDIMVVLADASPPDKLGKFMYRDVMLEVTYLPSEQFASPELILGDYHKAGGLRTPSIIADPTGQLTRLQTVVAREYAQRKWVYLRCEDARNNVLRHLQARDESKPWHDQVTAWVFGTGVTTHVLLVAGLKNPTVRKRYVAVRELLAEYGRQEFYATLLALLGCADMSRARAGAHLDALAEVFDAAKSVVKTPFPFAADISEAARPVAIDGSRELIERGCPREAVFWMVVTYARCLKVLYQDAPAEMQDRYNPRFREMVEELGIASPADLRRRSEQVREFLPRLWEEAEAILAANSEIED